MILDLRKQIGMGNLPNVPTTEVVQEIEKFIETHTETITAISFNRKFSSELEKQTGLKLSNIDTLVGQAKVFVLDQTNNVIVYGTSKTQPIKVTNG